MGNYRAVFLDRDGVVNKITSQYYVYSPDEFILNDGLIEFLEAMHHEGFLLVVISNQGGIARGLYGHDDADRVNRIFAEACRERGIRISEIYYCPHHPDTSKCLCRKPQPLMIEKAMARFGIDPGGSWMIGDNEKDIGAGKAAGLNTLRVEANEDLRPYIPKITGHK